MRKAHNGKIHLTNNGKRLRAVSFGYDFCSEHEWGFPPKRQYLEQPGRQRLHLMGQEGRVWKATLEEFQTVETDTGYAGFGHFTSEHAKEFAIKECAGTERDRKDEDVFAWDDRGFIVMSRDPKKQKLLQAWVEAAKKDPSTLCFIVGKWVRDRANGLTIGQTNFFSTEFKQMAEEDEIKNTGRVSSK